MRAITIHPALNGYVVAVGCQTVVFGGKLALLRALESYLENPEKVEKEYLRDAVNPASLQPEQAPTRPRGGFTNAAAEEFALANSRVGGSR